MPLTTTQVIEAKVRVVCTKPPLKGKRFYASRKYAKTVTVEEPLNVIRSVEHFLLKDGKWLKVSETEFKQATTEESEMKIKEELMDKLKKRVEEAYTKNE